jgi:hypothetical protein
MRSKLDKSGGTADACKGRVGARPALSGYGGMSSEAELLVDTWLKLFGPFACLHHRADHENHVEDARDASLIERMQVEPAANGLGGDICLEIRERQERIGFSATILPTFVEEKAQTRSS